MSADELDEIEGQDAEEIVVYCLTLTVAGPNYRDIIELEDERMEALEPTFPEINGLTYERYIGETVDEYVEVRFDYVVSRRLERIIKTPDPEPARGPAAETDDPERWPEERLERTEDKT